jgi:hypothetical protein
MRPSPHAALWQQRPSVDGIPTTFELLLDAHDGYHPISGAFGVGNFAVSVRVVAIIGVLAHAGLVVWHGAVVQRSPLQQDPLAAALAVICTGSGVAHAQEERPELPAQDSDHGGYPTCMVCVSWVAVLPPPYLVSFGHSNVSERIELIGEVIARHLAHLRPPPRGPPLYA